MAFTAVASPSPTVIKQPRIHSQMPFTRLEDVVNSAAEPEESIVGVDPQVLIDREWAFYENLSIADHGNNVDVLKWGYSMRKMMPLLWAVARQIHIVSASERVFSLMGNIITSKKRNRLNPRTVLHLVVVAGFLRHEMLNETNWIAKKVVGQLN